MDIQAIDSPERLHPFYVKTFDKTMKTESGEFEFYRSLARGKRVLDVGCGTGRISIEMANAGAEVVGMDLSPSILEVAEEKTRGRQDIRFIQGDLVDFELDQHFELIVFTGYSFHHALTPEAQRSCLAAVARHLEPNGVLIIHLDRVTPAWTMQLLEKDGGWTQEQELFHDPDTGLDVRMKWNCTYEPKTETVFSTLSWEFFGEDGDVVERRKASSIISHCYYRFEVEHLLARSGFVHQHLYGDFLKREYSLWLSSILFI